MLRLITRRTTQHQVFVLVSPPSVDFAVEMVNVIEGGVAELIGVEAVGTTLLKISQQRAQRLLSVIALGQFALGRLPPLDPRRAHPMFSGRK